MAHAFVLPQTDRLMQGEITASSRLSLTAKRIKEASRLLTGAEKLTVFESKSKPV
jgi:hypothetical protein